MLRTKCIVAPRSREDGIRISVMSRHTLPDGKTPDPDINDAHFDHHWAELAPPPKLVGSYYRGETSWEEFAEAYPISLERPEAQAKLHELVTLAAGQTVTVMCIERSAKKCHRRLLALLCKSISPSLDILVR